MLMARLSVVLAASMSTRQDSPPACIVVCCMGGKLSPGLPSSLAASTSLNAAAGTRELAIAMRAGGQVHTGSMRGTSIALGHLRQVAPQLASTPS